MTGHPPVGGGHDDRADDDRADAIRDDSWSGTALVAHHGEPTWRASAGFIAGPDSEPCSTDTRFQAGSISKHVMSVVVLALAHRGDVRLDEPIDRWMPDLPDPLRPITLRHLLSHRSGLGHWGDIPGLPALLETPPDRDALGAMITAAPPLSAPGERWRYSGPGFLLVAGVIEAATGRSYEDVVTELVLAPAGMDSTTSGRYPIREPGVAIGHRDGESIDVDEGFTSLPGTGDLWTTAPDLLRFRRAVHDGRILEPTVARELWSRHTPLDPPDPTDRPTAADAYGYGTFLGRVLGHRAWFVPGDNPGYQSLLAHLPERDIDVIVLSNEEDGVARALRAVGAQIGAAE